MANNIARRPGFSSCTALLLAALVFFWPALQTCARAMPAMSVSVKAGFEGKCKMGCTNPVAVEVEAGEGGADGVLKVEAGGNSYAYSLQIPENSRKTVRFFVPVYKPDIQISARFEKDGQILGQVAAKPEVLPENSVFIGVLSDEPEKYKYMNSADFSIIGARKTFAAALDEEKDLTDEALDSFNIIIIDDFDASRLDDGMQNALKRWVSKGNCILIGAKKYAYKNLKGLFEFPGTSTIAWGKGAVIFVQQDLEEADTKYVAALVRKHLTTPMINRMWGKSSISNRLAGAESLYSVVDESLRPSHRMFYLMLLLMLLYLAVGCFSIYLSKKRKWFFSAAVAGFCAVFYIAALGAGLRDTSAASAAVKLWGSKNTAESYVLIGVYPAHGKTCAVSMPSGEAMCPPDASCEYMPGEGRVVFSGDGPHYVFGASAEKCDLAEFELKLTREEILHGTIKNPFPYRLNKCFLVLGDTFINLGDIDGREEVQVKYRLDYGLRGMGDFNFLQEVERLSGLGTPERALLEYYFGNLEDGASGGKLFGFGQEQVKAEVDGRKRNLKSCTLHVFNVNLTWDGGKILFPWGYIKPAALASGEAWSLGRREFVPQDTGQVLLYYPLPPDFGAEEIDFYIEPSEHNSIQIYDWSDSAWEAFDGGTLRGERLVHSTSEGPLLMKIQCDSRVIFPEIYVKGAYSSHGKK